MHTAPDEQVKLASLNIDEHVESESGPHFDDLAELPPPPPPKISSEGIVAVDVTRDFLAAAATLEPGELVKDGFFTLFASVGALEVMDPKMDSGCLAPGESLDEDYDVTQSLLPSEVVGIIDQLLSLEMAWHLGYPLSQTVFTSVYIDKMLHPAPRSIGDADFRRDRAPDAPRNPMLCALRAYCLGLIKACHHVNERIKHEHYYEEEDFVTNTYNRPLLDDFPLSEIRAEIAAAHVVIHDLRGTLPDEMADALCLRLDLRTAFLRTFELSVRRNTPEELSMPWSDMQRIWEGISKTRHLGKSVPGAFSTRIQRRLASTLPPRPMVQPSPEETLEHFEKLIAHGKNAPKVLNYTDSQSLLNFVLTFQAQKPQPLAYIRALLQHFVFRDMVILGRLSIRQVLDDDLSIAVLPSSNLLDPANDEIEAPNHPRFLIAHHMELFRQRAAQSYLDLFRTLSQNRCRVRRTLFHMLQDWESLQVDAENIDQILQAYTEEEPLVYPHASGAPPTHALPLSSWTYHYKLRLMEWTVQLGFELDVYQPDELAGMYWYLGHLATTRQQHVARIQFFTDAAAAAAAAAAASDTSTTNTHPPNNQQYERSAAYHRLATLDAAVTRELASAFCNFYTTLHRLGALTPPPRPCSTDALRYEVRMKPFAAVGLPELPAFDAFTAAVTQPGVATAALLGRAAQCVAGARRGLKLLAELGEGEAFAVGCHERWLAGVRDWTRAAVALGVVVTTVQRAVEDGTAVAVAGGLGVEVPPPGKRYHDWWVVPKVVVAKM